MTEGMSKKLQQAVDYANKADSTGKKTNQPHQSKYEREGRKQTRG